MNDNRVDRAIDLAVRRIMSAEPPHGLRQRVLARLDGQPRRAALWPRLAFAAVAMAAIAAAVVLLRPHPVDSPDLPQMASRAPAGPVAPPSSPEVPPASSEPETASTRPAAPAPRVSEPNTPRREALPPPPRMDAVFGPPSDRVAAADASEAAVNLRLEFTFTLEGQGVEPARKTVTMVVADQQVGRHRSGEGDVAVIEARPRILPDGSIHVAATVEYRARGSEGAGLSDSVTAILGDTQSMVVSHAADARTGRRVSVELKATILKSRP